MQSDNTLHRPYLTPLIRQCTPMSVPGSEILRYAYVHVNIVLVMWQL